MRHRASIVAEGVAALPGLQVGVVRVHTSDETPEQPET